jgi:hypothetical protein
MKNKTIWILSSLPVMVLGFWIWCQFPGLPVERVLPAKPLAFARLEHVQEHINEIIRSDFGKNIAAIDLPDVLARNNFSPKDLGDVRQWQNDLAHFWTNPLMKRFLSREAAIAVYRTGNSYGFFMTLRLTFSTRLAEAMGQLSNHWGDGISVRRQKYLGRTINHVMFKKLGLGLDYVRIHDLLIVAPGPLGHLEDVVDVYRHKREPLQQDASFNFMVHNAYAPADGLVFVSGSLFSQLWRSPADTGGTALGYQPQAFPVYGLSYAPGVVSKYKILVGLDEKHMTLGLRKAFACPALANDTLKLVPVSAIAYNWGGCYDFEQSWAAARLRLNENPEFGGSIIHFKRNIEKYFHLNIKKDVLPVLGHEIGGYLTDVDMQGSFPFPFPRFLVFVKIQDLPAAGRLMDRLVENPVLKMQSETYNQAAIHYISLSSGANVDPGYAFLGDYLLVATSRQLLKTTIDAYHDAFRSIVSDDVVEQFSLDKGKKFHSVTLMKTAELSRRAQDFLGWADKYLADQVTMAAAYKQDGDSKKQELDLAIADKSAELLLAQKKLTQLKKTSLADVAFEDPTMVSGAIENLSREEVVIKDDIANYTEQKQDLARLLDNYASNARSYKLAMYNMDNIVSPVLKGLESINAQAITVRYGDKILETEFLVK